MSNRFEMENENMEIRFMHRDCTYKKYFDISTICTSFDHNLDDDTIQSNIASALASDGVLIKENDVVSIEIPEWAMNYDITFKATKQAFHKTNHNTSTNSTQSSTVISNSIQPSDFIKTWTSRAIHLLIENRSDLEQEFNGNKKNLKIWEKISGRLRESGIDISGPSCNTKFKNLMATFKDNLQRANKSGEGCINWEYYNIMKNNFGKKDSVAPKKITLFESSLTNFKKISNDDQPKEATKISKLNDEENSDDELTSIMPKKKKKKNFQEVLLEEFKEDRKSRDQFQKKLENFMETLISIEKSKLEKL